MTARAAATRRVNQGRGHRYVLDGTRCDGVTTAINTALAKPALTGWAARMVAELVAARRSILSEMSDEEIVDFLAGAPFRERDEAANRGTEVHRLAAELAQGREIEVPDLLVGRVDAYLDWFRRWEPTEIVVERTVVNRQYRFMGTFDLICRLEGLGTTLIDLKTNRSGPFGEVALQLAAYGHGETMFAEDYASSAAEVPMPEIESYAVLWITPDSWELYPYDVGVREFRTFLYLLETARWVWERVGSERKEPSRAVRGEALARPMVPRLEVVK